MLTMTGTFHIIRDGILYELTAEPEGGYTITIPALPSCISTGETIEEAMEMIADAMGGYLTVARERGYAVPKQFAQLAPAEV
jgi:predicted RNase H-like HicB family nuclease